jgi:predicted nucleic acid-binding protein
LTPDTSVLIAAYSPWHDQHEAAFAAVDGIDDLVAHAELEAYSVLTRMPAAQRAPADVVSQYLAEEFPGQRLVLSELARTGLLRLLAAVDVAAGAVYDALIALTAREHGLGLISLDRRASAVYERLDVRYELIG